MDPVDTHSSTHPLSELLHRQAASVEASKQRFSSFEIPSSSPKKDKVPFAEKTVIFDPLARGLDFEQQQFVIRSFEARKIEAPKMARIEPQIQASSKKPVEKTKAPEPQKTLPPATYTKNLKSEEAPADTSSSTGNQVDVVA